MSFGFSVGDFLAVGKLAIQLYSACASASEEFQELRRDLSSIHTVLYGLQLQADDSSSLLRRRCDDRKPEWEIIRENLEETLLEVKDLVDRYQKMGRNAWKRVRLGLKDLGGLRGKLGVHLQSINAFVGSLSLSALGRMEPTLGRIEVLLLDFIKEERLGNKAPTVISAHEEEDGPAWKQMKLDLLLGGIAREDLERNEDRIRELLDWVVNNERDLLDLKEIENGESVSQRQSFEVELEVEDSINSSSSITSELPSSTRRNSHDQSQLRGRAPLIQSEPERVEITEQNAQSRDASHIISGPSPHRQEIYSKSGCDIVRALERVANRKGSLLDIGKVDMTCAFIVCDITLHDFPIIYASDAFEKLTLYKQEEVLGRNCRFLQSPTGTTPKGVPRIHCDDTSVYYLKTKLDNEEEVQQSLVNYRKDGQGFMNILSIIPITEINHLSYKYYVGFLMDLVEQPDAVKSITNELYAINYTKGMRLDELHNPKSVATLRENRKHAFLVLGRRFTDRTIQRFLQCQSFQIILEWEWHFILDMLNSFPLSRTDWEDFNRQLDQRLPYLRTDGSAGIFYTTERDPSYITNAFEDMLLMLRYVVFQLHKIVSEYKLLADEDGKGMLEFCGRMDPNLSEDSSLKHVTHMNSAIEAANFSSMQLAIMKASHISKAHPTCLKLDTEYSKAYVRSLCALLRHYNNQLSIIATWDCPLPRELKLRIMNYHEAMPTESVRVTVHILILDQDITHFGRMFEHLLPSYNALSLTFKNVTPGLDFRVHHFGSCNAWEIKNTSALTAEQLKRVEKITVALRSNGISRHSFPEMLLPWLNHHYHAEDEQMRYRQPYEYDFILVVPPCVGRYAPSDRILTPWSTSPVRYSTLARCHNFMDALDTRDPYIVYGDLKLPYRTSLFPVRQKDHFEEARKQVSGCVDRILYEKLRCRTQNT